MVMLESQGLNESIDKYHRNPWDSVHVVRLVLDGPQAKCYEAYCSF